MIPHNMLAEAEAFERLRAAVPSEPWEAGTAPEEPLPTFLIGADGLLWCRVVGSPSVDAEAIVRLILVARSTQLPQHVRQLHAENARLRDELALWKPMTPEEADAAMEAAEAEPFSEEEIDRIMAKVLDPAYRPTEPEHVQLAAKVNKLQAERDRYRSIVGNVVRWCRNNSIINRRTIMVDLKNICGISDRDAARELCREFGINSESGQPAQGVNDER